MAESDSWPQGSSRVLGLLRRLYEDRVFDRRCPEDAATYAGLQALFEALKEEVGCSRPARSSPQGDLLDFIELTTRRLSKLRIPSGTAGANVEIVGWLDLALDDAPDVVVTGLNEGTIPQSVSADGLMSEPLRRVLGLVDGDRRYVRDLVLLSALVESRRLTLIAGRRSRDEEPLVPSRLVLACDPSLLAATVLEFYGPAQRPHRADSTASGESSGFTFVAPGRSEGTIQRLSVTAFRDYLSCPYRFYLKHVLRLRESRDLPIEMRPIDFGSLAHEILRRFASTGASSSPEDRTVLEALERLLDRVVAERFGSLPVIAVRIQVEQLRRRLRSFASWQAKQVRCGWVVDQTFAERSLTATITVDEGRLVISGRVDRLDRHPDLGIRVLDYKTGERPSSPDRAHCERRGGELRWRDLQLPLYHFLVRETGEEEDVSLGFVNLARDPRAELLATADWSQETIQEAMTAARAVVRDVLLQRFWPPAGPPGFDDGLSGLAGDRWLEREAMIRAAPLSFE